MREIKFRGLNRLTKEWVYGYLVVDGESCQIWQTGGLPVPVDKETVGEFTGRKDKDGKEIYEGDIVESLFRLGEERNHYLSDKDTPFKRMGVVEYIHTEFCLNNTLLSIHKELKVIGNVSENPELLEDKVTI